MTLEVDRLAKRFGSVVALDGLSFVADAGDVRWGGRSSAELPRSVWGYLPEERGLYPRMTVLQQLVFFGGLYGVPPERAKREVLAWLARFRVPAYADRRADELSKGNQQ